MTRNRFAGESFTDDDDAIAKALEEVSIPALMCSLVHMTGDPSFIRGDIRPRIAMSLDIQSGMSERGPCGGASPCAAGDRGLSRQRLRAGGSLHGSCCKR